MGLPYSNEMLALLFPVFRLKSDGGEAGARMLMFLRRIENRDARAATEVLETLSSSNIVRARLTLGLSDARRAVCNSGDPCSPRESLRTAKPSRKETDFDFFHLDLFD